jgi:ATP phosphoribosyltransferase regulatory subunit
VTLSIVKSYRDGEDSRVCYSESVYRVPRGGDEFREITQAGLEYLGEVDDYVTAEILILALRSLAAVRDRSVLEVSHLGLLGELLSPFALSESEKREAIALIGERNAHGLSALLSQKGDGVSAAEIAALLHARTSPASMLERISALLPHSETPRRLATVLRAAEESAPGAKIRFDLSVTGDLGYYSGTVFRGFAEGAPDAVLSGGEYSPLMRKMGKKAGAIGFAVYLDLLEKDTSRDFDGDVFLRYKAGADVGALCRAAARLAREGRQVTVGRALPEGRVFRRVVEFEED